MREDKDKLIETQMALLLKVGVVVSAVLVLIGGVIGLVKMGTEVPIIISFEGSLKT